MHKSFEIENCVCNNGGAIIEVVSKIAEIVR